MFINFVYKRIIMRCGPWMISLLKLDAAGHCYSLAYSIAVKNCAVCNIIL